MIKQAELAASGKRPQFNLMKTLLLLSLSLSVYMCTCVSVFSSVSFTNRQKPFFNLRSMAQFRRAFVHIAEFLVLPPSFLFIIEKSRHCSCGFLEETKKTECWKKSFSLVDVVFPWWLLMLLFFSFLFSSLSHFDYDRYIKIKNTSKKEPIKSHGWRLSFFLSFSLTSVSEQEEKEEVRRCEL